jgi:hypothetical protein
MDNNIRSFKELFPHLCKESTPEQKQFAQDGTYTVGDWNSLIERRNREYDVDHPAPIRIVKR